MTPQDAKNTKTTKISCEKGKDLYVSGTDRTSSCSTAWTGGSRRNVFARERKSLSPGKSVSRNSLSFSVSCS